MLAEAVDLDALCREEVERLSLLSPDLDVVLASHDGPPMIVTADHAACREILSNLGDNARRHARSTITLSTRAGDHSAEVWMIDDGPGLGAAGEHAFSRFVSLDGRGGSGLGLPIGRALAEAMHGSLRYESGFVLALPVDTEQGNAPADVSTDYA